MFTFRFHQRFSAVSILALLIGTALAAKAVSGTGDTPRTEGNASAPIIKAIQIAKSGMPTGIATSATTVTGGPSNIYYVTFFDPDSNTSKGMEVDVSSETVLTTKDVTEGDMRMENPLTRDFLNAKVTLAQAIQSTLRRFPNSTVTGAAASFGRRFNYRIFLTADGKVTEARVDPENGKVFEVIKGSRNKGK